MRYIIMAVVSAMAGGAVGLFFGCACAAAARADKNKQKGEPTT